MRIALEVWSARFDEVRATCLRAEALGLDGFYYGESPHALNLDCWTTLGALASITERIRLGPVITNVLPTYRCLALLAKQSATLTAIAPDRLDFRTGAGAAIAFARPWWEPFGIEYPPYDHRLDELHAALGLLPDLWARSGVSAPPITIAATGRRAMRLAAEQADIWETSFATPAEFGERWAALRAVGVGRDVRTSLEIDGFVSMTRDGVRRLTDQVRAERGSEDLEAVLGRALIGTPVEVARQLDALANVGVDQVVVALHDPHEPDAIEALASARSAARSQHRCRT
ncbi:MAG: LLM class flavin-dependent oxidoreductase [Acidimicrobiia bacterium]|nr:LLM class flavin-dependent oxidoreductase [Acidimicrobiia bacterium]